MINIKQLNKLRTIYVDMDSTITDSISAYCDCYNLLYKNYEGFKPANPNKVACWNLSDEAPLAQYNTGKIFGSELFFQLLNPFPNALEILEKLSLDFNIVIVSIGSFNNIQWKAKYIHEKLPFIKKAVLLTDGSLTMNKSIVAMEDDSIFIDDVKSNLDSIANRNVTKIIYGKRYVWNNEWTDLWANNWIEVENILKGLNK